MTLNSAQESFNKSPQQPGSKLCLDCGLCCRGVVVTYAFLMPSEVDKAKRLNLSVCQQDGRDTFNLPCSHHINGKCTVYENRFKVCESYKCEMLKRLLAGEVSLEEALKIVAITQNLEKEIYELIGEFDSSKNVWDLLREFFEANYLKKPGELLESHPELLFKSQTLSLPGELLKNHPELLFKIRTLSLVINKYFEPSMDKQLNSTVHPVRTKRSQTI